MKTYQDKKHLLKLSERYLEFFEYRNGFTDGIKHTFKETGDKFGVGGTRAGQIIARVEYELGRV
ncbi:MAG: hypothetical protein RLY66_344 [Candidatus Parcubacteria bacterium]|jgi:DNA-directed RNA polymerase sigma subunit (sigma70/sigma32)